MYWWNPETSNIFARLNMHFDPSFLMNNYKKFIKDCDFQWDHISENNSLVIPTSPTIQSLLVS